MHRDTLEIGKEGREPSPDRSKGGVENGHPCNGYKRQSLLRGLPASTWTHRDPVTSHTATGMILVKCPSDSITPDLKLPIASSHTWNKIQSPRHGLRTSHDGSLLY